MTKPIRPQMNRQWRIAGNPAGRAVRQDDFALIESPVPALENGQIRVQVEYLEFTPSLKGQMENRLSYAEKIEEGAVMRGRGIGRVIDGRSETIKAGDVVHGYMGWQEIATLSDSDVKVLADDDYARLHLGPLGSTGMAAYFGLFEVGEVKEGDTVIISGAAGAVGTLVGQMARIKNCRVIGVAGGQDKCLHLIDNLGLDVAIDYKSEDLHEAMQAHAPEGFDVIYDNVGGPFLEAALGNMATGARVVICGAISRYETDNPPPGPSNYFKLVHNSAKMQGFISVNYRDRFPEAQAKIREWLESEDFRYFEDIQQGFENAPTTFMRLFSGKNLGKQLLKL